MKAVLRFNLDDADDSIAHLRAVKSLDLSLVLWELCRNSKKSIEYEIENKNLDGYQTLELVYERIYELMEEHDVNINKLVV
jgi:hypothetical protein